MHTGIHDLLLHHHVGLGERGLGGRRITGFPVEAVVVLLALEVGSDDFGVGVERLAGVDDRVQRFVVDVDEFQRVPGGVAVLGDDERHLLALEPHPVGGEHGLHVVGQGRHPGQPLFRQIGAGHHGLDLRMCLRRRDIDAVDLRVGVRRTQDRQVQHAAQIDVVDVVAAAPDEARVLLAEHPAVAARLLIVVGLIVGRWRTGLCSGHAFASSFACWAAHCTDRTIVVYPVHRQICPEMASRISSSVGSGLRSSSARAVIIMPGVQNPHCNP